MTDPNVHPYLASEIGTLLRAIDPAVSDAIDRILYSDDPLTPEQLEGVMIGAFLAGYGHAIDEQTKGQLGKLANEIRRFCGPAE